MWIFIEQFYVRNAFLGRDGGVEIELPGRENQKMDPVVIEKLCLDGCG